MQTIGVAVPIEAANPYAAPVEITEPVAKAQRRTSVWLTIPAVALIALSLVWLMAGILAAVIHVWVYWLIFAGVPSDFWKNSLEFAVVLACLASNAIILIGAWNMRRGKRYRLAVAAAVLACVPILSPAIYLGIPFGLWALVSLLRRSTREAFHAIPTAPQS